MIVAVTQRVDTIESYTERRDALDQRWTPIFNECGITPLLIPNDRKIAEKLLLTIPVAGVLLTGGGDLLNYGGTSPERDDVESLLIQKSTENRWPVLGVCRGMQAIQNYFEVPLSRVSNHVACRHPVLIDGRTELVNSFHNFGALTTTDKIKILGRSPDGVIEYISHRSLPIRGIMWHPEREEKLSAMDRQILTEIFKGS